MKEKEQYGERWRTGTNIQQRQIEKKDEEERYMEKVTDCHIKIFLTAPKTHKIEQGTKGGNVKRRMQKKIKSGKRKIKHELEERSWNARDQKARR